MEKNKKNNIAIVFMIIIIFAYFFINLQSNEDTKQNYYETKKSDNTLNIISSSENQDLEDIIIKYATEKKYNINIEYAGTF